MHHTFGTCTQLHFLSFVLLLLVWHNETSLNVGLQGVPPPTQIRRFLIAQMHLAVFLGGTLMWWNLQRTTKCREISHWNCIFDYITQYSHYVFYYMVRSVRLWPLLTVLSLSAFSPSGFRTVPSVALKIPEPWNADSPIRQSLWGCLSVNPCVCHPSLPSTQLY